MNGDATNEELDDVAGGPDTVAPIITDALEEAAGGDFGPFPDGENSDESLDAAAGGQQVGGDAFIITEKDD